MDDVLVRIDPLAQAVTGVECSRIAWRIVLGPVDHVRGPGRGVPCIARAAVDAGEVAQPFHPVELPVPFAVAWIAHRPVNAAISPRGIERYADERKVVADARVGIHNVAPRRKREITD